MSNEVDGKAASTDARNARLTLRKTNEEVLRKQLQLEARKKCADSVKEFAACARDEGVWVILNCRSKNQAMSDCMDQYYNEDEFKKFLVREKIDLKIKETKTIFQSAYEVIVPQPRS